MWNRFRHSISAEFAQGFTDTLYNDVKTGYKKAHEAIDASVDFFLDSMFTIKEGAEGAVETARELPGVVEEAIWTGTVWVDQKGASLVKDVEDTAGFKLLDGIAHAIDTIKGRTRPGEPTIINLFGEQVFSLGLDTAELGHAVTVIELSELTDIADGRSTTDVIGELIGSIAVGKFVAWFSAFPEVVKAAGAKGLEVAKAKGTLTEVFRAAGEAASKKIEKTNLWKLVEKTKHLNKQSLPGLKKAIVTNAKALWANAKTAATAAKKTAVTIAAKAKTAAVTAKASIVAAAHSAPVVAAANGAAVALVGATIARGSYGAVDAIIDGKYDYAMEQRRKEAEKARQAMLSSLATAGVNTQAIQETLAIYHQARSTFGLQIPPTDTEALQRTVEVARVAAGAARDAASVTINSVEPLEPLARQAVEQEQERRKQERLEEERLEEERLERERLEEERREQERIEEERLEEERLERERLEGEQLEEEREEEEEQEPLDYEESSFSLPEGQTYDEHRLPESTQERTVTVSMKTRDGNLQPGFDVWCDGVKVATRQAGQPGGETSAEVSLSGNCIVSAWSVTGGGGYELTVKE